MIDGPGLADFLNMLLLAAAGAAVVLGLALLLLWRQNRRAEQQQGQAGSQAAEIETILAAVQTELKSLRQGAQAYPLDDPPPYQPAAGDLHELLDRLQERQASLAEQLKQLSAHRPQAPLTQNRPDSFIKPVKPVYGFAAWLWFDLWAGPRYWRQQLDAFEQLLQEARALRARLTDAAGLLQSLAEMPLRVAEQAVEMRQAIERMLHLEQALRNFEVHGSPLDTAAAETRQFRSVLQTLPAYFFEPVEATVQQQATKNDTAAAWQTLYQLARPVGDGLTRFETWQRDYLAIRQEVEQMRQALPEAATALALLAPAVELAEWLAELRAASDLRQKLEKVYPALDVETFAEFAALAGQVTQTAYRLIRQAEETGQAVRYLNEAIPQNAAALIRIEQAMSELAHQPSYPVAWGPFQVEFERLHQVEAEIGPAISQRSPAQLRLQADQARRLAQAAETLAAQVNQVQEQREALLPLLARLELAGQSAWFSQAKTLQHQVKPYAPANWTPQQAVSKLEEEAKRLARQQQRWLPRQARAALPAADMADRLREVKQLLADLETFQTRLQGVTETLTLVQQQEQQATDRLAAGRPALERLVERLQRASPALAGEANWRRKQLEKRVGQGRKLAGGLKRRGSGQVAEKERQIVTWLEASYHDLSGLLPLLQSEARRLDAELRRVVTALPAPSEGQETLIQELRRLLVVDRSAAGPTLPPVAEGDVQRLLHLVELVESRLEDRENLERLLRKLT